MNYYINKLSHSIRKNGLIKTIKLIFLGGIVSPLLTIFFRVDNNFEKIGKPDFDKITNDLSELGYQPISYYVDTTEFEEYLKIAKYPDFYIEDIERRRKGRFRGKALEHFITLKIFNFKDNDIYIDIASSSSTFPDIARTFHNTITSYKLDFVYEKGINGDKIGADATATGLNDNLCDKISLHCAYEMFLNEDDIKLIPEMYRILKKDGLAIIIPLYLHNFGYICRNPAEPGKEKPVVAEGETLYWRTKGNTHRKYSAQTLHKRVLTTAENIGFETKLYIISNLDQITDQLDSPYFIVFRKK
ncbi:MAG: hypothetical protein KAW92_12445 [Candidatus Cloacimonetes bacterium]|nr:hypothetical protein [Candidatus Cloacimonadota bacterium]